MYRITKTMYTETAHRLLLHKGLCHNLHGHSYKWEVALICSDTGLNDEGMITDFANVKEAMEEVIGKYDHAVILNSDDPFVPAVRDMFERVWTLSHMEPTAENMAKVAFTEIRDILNINRYEVYYIRVWETATSYAEYIGEY